MSTFTSDSFISVSNLASTNASMGDGRSVAAYTIANTYPITPDLNTTTAVTPDPTITLTPDQSYFGTFNHWNEIIPVSTIVVSLNLLFESPCTAVSTSYAVNLTPLPLPSWISFTSTTLTSTQTITVTPPAFSVGVNYETYSGTLDAFYAFTSEVKSRTFDITIFWCPDV